MTTMRTSSEVSGLRSRRRGRGEDGAVLLVVVLLVVMFTGLGLVAMRHTRSELRASGAFLDGTQAASLAEAALAMVATDLRLSSDYYRAQFMSQTGAPPYALQFSAVFDGSSYPAGKVPGFHTAVVTVSHGLGSTQGDVSVTHTGPVWAPPPAGFSNSNEQNFGWYYFSSDASATYGPPDAAVVNPGYVSGSARGRVRVVVGPIAAYGN